MASVYSRERKTGIFWYVDFKGRTFPAGKGRTGEEDAREIAVELERRARRARAGIVEPAPCLWTIADLFGRVEAESKARDPASTRAYRKGRIARIRAVFPDATRIAAITRDAIDRATRHLAEHPARPARATAGGRVGANRAMIELRRALRMAREEWHADSNYNGDPFRGWKPYDEGPTKRAPIIVGPDLRAALVAAAARIVADATPQKRPALEQDAAMLELFFLTASRLSQVMRMEKAWIRDGLLIFPAQKRGRERVFPFAGRIRAIIEPRLSGPSRFVFPQRRVAGSRRDRPRDNMAAFWRLLAAQDGIPKGLSAHHIKHSQITAGSAAGLSDEELMQYGGWTSTQMLHLYRHPGRRVLRPMETAQALTGRKRRTAPKRRKSLK